jgi:hypothetical protein
MRPLCSAILGINQVATVDTEPRESAGLVLTHEPAVTGYISGKDGREPAIDPLSAQFSPSFGDDPP